MRPVDEDDYRGRVDGRTPRQDILTVGRLSRGRDGARWMRGEERREKCVDVVDRVLNNDELHPIVQLKAVELALKMEQQCMIDERMQAEIEAVGNVGEGQVILVLPSNGSEIGAAGE